MAVATNLRNAQLEDLVPMLQAQKDAKLDVVVPAQAIRSEGALLKVQGIRATAEGDLTVEDILNPTPTVTTIRPTEIMDGQIAAKLGIPSVYLKNLRTGKAGKTGFLPRPDLYDANVNGWIHGYAGGVTDTVGPDGRSFLLRTFVDPDGGEGIGRALLSDKYAPIENLTVLLAAMQGIKMSGVEANVVHANLSERRMNVRFAAPGIKALAPVLLEGYRSPVPGVQPDEFGRWRQVAQREGMGYQPGAEPVVFAGFDLDNSETGGGAFNVTPVITVQVCKNGLKLNLARFRRVHLGARMDEGQVNWSEETQRRQLELVVSQTQDAVRAFLDPEFLAKAVSDIEAKAGVKLENPAEQVQFVAKRLAFTEEQAAGILDHFIKGGQPTAGGLANAITSYAQLVDNPDEAYDLEGVALQAMELVAA